MSHLGGFAARTGAHTDFMTDNWTPALRVHETRDRLRLWLGSYAYGEGRSLQDAADDLVSRLLSIAMSFRSGAGIRVSAELGPIDLRWFELVYELGEIAAGGGDIRVRVFGCEADEREAA
jgi:hypothetical protein